MNYLRDPATPGNQVEEGELTLAQRFRQASAQLARMYALCSSSGALTEYRDDIAFFEEIRSVMARFDADDRRARGETVPPDVELYLKALAASAVESGGVTDIYAAAGSSVLTCPTWTTRSSSGCAPSATPPWPSRRCAA